jgi:hypothetical protein
VRAGAAKFFFAPILGQCGARRVAFGI